MVLLVFLLFTTLQSATINIRLTSEHTANSVTYDLYFNGKLITSGNLPATYIASGVETFHFPWSFTDAHSLTVMVQSTGGELGPVTHQQTITVTNGGSYNISLTC